MMVLSLIGLGGIKRPSFDADISTLFGNDTADLQGNGWRPSFQVGIGTTF